MPATSRARDERFLEMAPPAGQRNVRPDHLGDAGDQCAAIDVEPVGEHENAGKILGFERAPDAGLYLLGTWDSE